MKRFPTFSPKSLPGRAFLLLAVALFAGGSARAGLTVDVHLYHDNDGYFFYPYLNANTNPPNFPDGVYQIASPQIPAAGSRQVYEAAGGILSPCYNGDCGGGSYYGNFDSMLYGITNGLWTITVTNSTATNVFFFPVTVTGLTSNVFGAPPQTVYPASGAINVPNDPVFEWTGPANWEGTLYVEDDSVDTNGNSTVVASAALPPATTSWTTPSLLPLGTNSFYVSYQSNVTAMVTASQPTNSAGQPISGWVSTATLQAQFVYGNQYSFYFTVSLPENDYYPFLVARYNFEDTNNPYADTSGNNYGNDCTTSSGTNYDTFSTDTAVGQYARLFFGDTWFCFSPFDFAYPTFSNTLSGNFSVTAWVNTTNTTGNDYDNAYYGAPIFFAAADYNDHCTIPLSITGRKAAFTIVSSDGPPYTITLHSQTSVNDGKYHFLAVTRQQSTGLMSLYVDGALEATSAGITNPVITQGYISIAGGYYAYAGLLDDVRLYSTNLSAADVADLGNGGTVITLASAVGATNLTTVSTSGDANWFVETTNTYNGMPAADQSGAVSNYQSSILTATVTGPGTLTFDWSSQDNDPNQGMDYEFAVDDLNTNDIADLNGGGNGWQSIEATTGGPIVIPPGQHTLIWQVFAGGDADPFQAGFLDNVVFMTPDTNAVSASITFNIYREQDPSFGDIYVAFPSFNSVTPAGTGTTTNTIQSPNQFFNGRSDQGGGGSGSAILYSLASVLNEATNGLWSLYINYGLQNQRRFQFSVAISGLTTNLLAPVQILAPTNHAPNFPANGTIQWLGPGNYTSLNVSKQNIDGSAYVGAVLPVTATAWTPGLDAGTNRTDVNYASNNFPTVSFSVPVDAVDSQTVSVWSGQANLNTTATSIFLVSTGAAPVMLVSPQAGAGNFQFSFQSQSGFTNTVQYRTNLILGNWQTWSNLTGDGTLKTLALPVSLFSPSPVGYIRVSTQ